MSEKKQSVIELVFESGKKICVRPMQIRDLDMASQAAARRGGGDNQFVFQMGLQRELLKVLLVSVDGKKLTAVELEQLDSLLEPAEYMALLGEIQGLMGNAQVTGRNFI